MTEQPKPPMVVDRERKIAEQKKDIDEVGYTLAQLYVDRDNTDDTIKRFEQDLQTMLEDLEDLEAMP